MADVITGTPQLDATEMELIQAFVQKELKEKSIVAKTVADVSVFAKPGSKSISFPKSDSFTAVDRAKSTVVDATALTFANDTLLLDKDPTVKYIIDSFSDLQAMVDAEMESAKRATSAGSRFIEDAVLTAMLAAAGHQAEAVPADISAAAILEMQEFALQNNEELENLWLVISVDQRSIMLGLPEFSEAQIYGSAVIPRGVIGQVYGMPVLVSNSLALGKQQAMVYSTESTVLGFQRAWRRDEEKAIDFGTGAMKVVWDAVFGTKVVQLGQGTLIDGTTPLGGTVSPLIAKLNA